MSVHYKFKSTLDYDTVSFDGLHISVADLKKAIFHQKRIGKNTDFDLQITNAQTKEDYTDDNALIAKNTSLIVARVPLTVQQKRSWDRNETPPFNNLKDEANLGRAVDLTRLDGSEEDKIRAMMTQSTQDYDPSNYMKIRGANQTGDVPANYRCYKCHQPGHWIKNCPLGTNQEPIEIKKSTGIPRSFMVPVEGPLVPGAMMTPTGHYAVPAIDHQAYKEGKKERPPFSQDPEPVVEKPEIPEDLLCNICKDLLTDAVMIPCCGNSFCDECIRTFLLESEEHECPDCNEKDVSPETLIPNRFLRNAVMNFKNETGYAKRQTYRPAVQSAGQPSAAPTEQPKVETQQIASQSPQTAQSSSVPSAPSQESTEPPQPVNLESTSQQHVPATTTTTTTTTTSSSSVQPQTLSTLPESTSESHLQSDSVTKLTTDEETEVPPPPGTEPLLPIPAIVSSPEREQERRSQEPPCREKKERDNDYAGERQSRERRRSFSRDSHRERSGERGRRIENLRPLNRRRSLSPRHSQHSDYPTSSGVPPHLMNPPPSKGYQGHLGDDGHYPPAMHYDSGIRRSNEDRPGTPTVDEPHLHVPSAGNQPPLLPFPPGEERIPPPNYNQPPPNVPPHNPPLLPDPYMSHRIPIYPHQQGSHYGPPRYDRPPYQQQGYRPSQPPRNYNGPPRPIRGLHHMGYRGIQPPPPGLGRNIHNGNPPGIIDDPLEAFERMLREKDERDRRLGKHRRRSRTRSRSRSYSRSRSRSFGRRSPFSSRISRSRSPPSKRRSSRSPLPLRGRSRTPKRRSNNRSRSGSFSISRSRSYSRSQSPRLSPSRDRDRERDRERERERERDRERDRDRDRDRDRERDRDRDLLPRYRSPVRSPPRFQRERDRERERPRSREPRDGYNTYYNDSPAHDYQFRDRERDLPPRERPLPRYPIRNQSSQHNIPPLMSHLVTGGHPPPPLMSLGPPPTDRKDYYDSYNRYSGPPPPAQRFGSPLRDPPPHKRFDDVAPPGTEGYYDLSPPGVEHSDRILRDDRERQRSLREQEDREHSSKDRDNEERDRLSLRDDRGREREDRMRERDERDRRIAPRDREDRDRPVLPRDHEDRIREKDERDRREKEKERDDRHIRDRRDDDRHIDKKDYDKDRYRDDRDRHRQEDKSRQREKERRERDYEPEKDRDRHERYERRSVERKKSSRKSLTPYSQKSRGDAKDLSPERPKKKEKDHEEKVEEKKKEKKIKEKKKKKDSDEKEKKKKKKKEKKSSQKEAALKDDSMKVMETEDVLADIKTADDTSSSPLKADSMKTCNEEENIESRIECMHDETSIVPSIKEEFEDKSLAMNPEPPEFHESSPGRIDHAEFGTNPPNPNFKPIPELKSDMKPTIDSLYGGLDDTEINTVITEKYSLMSSEHDNNAKEAASAEKSPKKDEFLAPIPELSKWERDDTIEKPEDDENDDAQGSPTEKMQTDEPKSTKVVTSEVLKRAENAIFQKAINAIRPIEIKKISESRKILYQNPEPKVLEAVEPAVAGGGNREPRKSVNVTINVGRNERNVEITEPVKKAKLDRTKFKPVPETYSPTRLSAKERLGEKVEDNKERKISPIKSFMERRDSKNENQSRSRSPRREKRLSSPMLERRVETSSLSLTGERKVFLEDRKRDKDRGSDRSKDRSDFRSGDRHDIRPDREGRIDCRTDFRSNRNDMKGDSRADKDREKDRDRERRGRTPPASSSVFKSRTEMSKMGLLKSKDDEEERRRDKKGSREEKKRKKEHRSRSKSKEHKKRKEKKHKKDKEKNQEKKQKHKDSSATAALKEKSDGNETKLASYETTEQPLTESLKKQRKNPRLVSDRKRSILDEASFEPDYSASDSETDGEEKSLLPSKKLKLDDSELDKEMEMKSLKKRSKSTSSEDTSSSSDSTSSDSDSSDESHRKKRKKHKKHKKKKSTKKDSSSDSDTYSDSSDSSTDEERHKKKSKKSKSRSKQSKKKKKSKHK